MKHVCVLAMALVFGFSYELRPESGSGNLISLVFPDLTDTFPLTKGLLCTYQYKGAQSSWTEFSASWSQDSGIVTYHVMDSSRVNDTTVAWTIRQKRNVMVRSGRFPFPHDTVYFISDSSIVTLSEFTTGRHALRCSSYVWKFPRSPECPVFRFSDSSNARVFYTFQGCRNVVIVGNYDSLWFSQDSGLIRREYSLCSEPNYEDGWYDRRSSRLLTRLLVAVDEVKPLPSQFALCQNYPNPFNPTTRIEYSIPKAAHVSLKVFDVMGREIATLVDGIQEAGFKSVEFSARGGSASGGDATGLASGVYFYRLSAGGFVETRKLMLIR